MRHLRVWAWVIMTAFIALPPAVAVACVVNATEIVGLAVWNPENGVDDYRSLTYFPDTEEWGLARADFQGGEWHRANIQNAGALMVREFTSAGSIQVPWIAPRAGKLTALTVCTSPNVGPNASYTVTIYKNGTGTGIAVTIPASGSTGRSTLIPSQFVGFAADDQITLFDGKTGSPYNAVASAQWFGVFTE